uniref:uncharacterized protein LOC122578130 n=1 Tax=Erigeron canadensis TaxID=72917 RepID=UPI001CB904F1|nr:uncharacterized protein LOC122578130 [Erigeron canadensis]
MLPPPPVVAPSPPTSTDDLLRQLIESHNTATKTLIAHQDENDIVVRNHGASIRNLEHQIWQVVKLLTSERQLGMLPSNTVPNPKEEVNMISSTFVATRSDEDLGPMLPPPTPVCEIGPETLMEKTHDSCSQSTMHVPPPVHPHVSLTDSEPHVAILKRHLVDSNENPIRVPYPNLMIPKESREISKLLVQLKNVKIDLSLLDACVSIPKSAKAIKDLLSKKEKLKELSNVPINAKCSASLLNKLPKKLGDPGKFTIPCHLRESEVSNALTDLGACINLMSYSLYKRLGFNDLKPTKMTLMLADQSLKSPMGIAANMVMRVGKFHFPVDFVVVDVKQDHYVPFILGRPFLNTATAVVDVFDKTLTLRVDDKKEVFNVDKSFLTFTEEDIDTIQEVYSINPSEGSSGDYVVEITPHESLTSQTPMIHPFLFKNLDSSKPIEMKCVELNEMEIFEEFANNFLDDTPLVKSLSFSHDNSSPLIPLGEGTQMLHENPTVVQQVPLHDHPPFINLFQTNEHHEGPIGLVPPSDHLHIFSSHYIDPFYGSNEHIGSRHLFEHPTDGSHLYQMSYASTHSPVPTMSYPTYGPSPTSAGCATVGYK